MNDVACTCAQREPNRGIHSDTSFGLEYAGQCSSPKVTALHNLLAYGYPMAFRRSGYYCLGLEKLWLQHAPFRDRAGGTQRVSGAGGTA